MPEPPALRSLVLYLLVAAGAALIWGWYFFAYVPPKLQYFLGMRFRTLAVAAGQLKSKTESLSTAIKTANAQDSAKFDAAKYLEAVIPELRPANQSTEGLGLDGRLIPWSEVLAQASDASKPDFDDLILADESGNVLWQRERTTPRIGSLPQLLTATTDSGWSPFALSWGIRTTRLVTDDKKLRMPDTATSAEVNLDGTAILVITQPVKLSAPVQVNGVSVKTLYLAGVGSRAALQAQAMHVPTEWVVLALLPFALVFLALPFLKLATVTPSERYGFIDVVGVGVATVVAAAIAGALPFTSDRYNATSDASLSALADGIQDHLRQEALRFIRLTTAVTEQQASIESSLSECETAILDRSKTTRQKLCDFWNVDPKLLKGLQPGFAELDVISWVGRDGWQQKKWSTKRQITGLISQGDFQHFRDILAHRWWSIDGSARYFTIEPLRSPTTSDMAFVFAVPTFDHDTPMLALNVKPQSLVDPVLPPGYGFAVLASDGRVLFHSQAALSLEENFYREVGDPTAVTRLVNAGRIASWTGDYHGRQHRFFARRLDSFVDCPWKIVTFRELEPLLAFSAGRQSGAMSLLGLNLLVLLAVVGIFLAVQKARGRLLMDVVMASLIQSRHPEAVWASIRQLLLLAAMSIVAIAITYIVSPGWLDLLYLVFVSTPVLAIALVVRNRRSSHTREKPIAVNDPFQYWRSSLEIGLVALVVGALPTAGVVRIVHRLDDTQRRIQWLKESRDRAAAREMRVRAAVMTTHNYEETQTKASLLGEGGFAAWLPVKNAETAPYFYLPVLANINVEQEDSPSYRPYPSPAVEGLLGQLRGGMGASNVQALPVELSADRKRIRLSEPGPSGLYFVGDYETGARDLALWPSVWGLLLIGTVFAVDAWARQTLSTRCMAKTADLADAVRSIQNGALNRGILFIGPPRGEKDRIARETIETVTHQPPLLSIRLLDATLTSTWIESQMKRLDARLAESSPETQAPAWVHVSNFETQLLTPESRTQVLRLCEMLLQPRSGRQIAVVVSSAIDPIGHYSEVFLEERREIYSSAVPEVELNRSALLLSRFRRCYLGSSSNNPWPSWLEYKPREWRETLCLETSNHRLLADIGAEIERAWTDRDEVGMDELRAAVRVRAEACYQLLWTSCTRSEKLILIQLAQEGLINPKSRDTFNELMAKGLILEGPPPVLFSITFRDFLSDIERDSVVQEWERKEGTGVWMMAGRLVASVATVGLAFYLLTQGFAVQSVLPIVSGSGLLGAPIIREVASRFITKKGAANA